jgi:menaquinone-dependent protoporphyrinogen oxidase
MVVEVEPGGLLRLMPGVVVLVGRREEGRIWGNLKRLLESGDSARYRSGETMTAARAGLPPDQALEPSRTAAPADAAGRPTVLVADASGHGSTRGTAQRIAARLERTMQVDLRPVEDVDDLELYGAAILGSGVYSQGWIPSATEFVRRNADTLAARSVWLFSVGSFGDIHRVIGRLMRHEPKEIREIQHAIHPREYRVFAGVIQRHQWPLPSRLFFHAFGGRFGDNRNWREIEAWADSLARSLKQSRCRGSDSATPAREFG